MQNMLHKRNRLAILATSVIALAFGAMPATGQTFSKGYQFLEDVRKGDGNAVTEALAMPGQTIVNSRDVGSGQTALHIVTARRDLTWMQVLLAKGANVNARDKRGVTPLMTAANLGFADGVELLLKQGATSDIANDAGETPLIGATHRRDLAMMRVLLSHGADPDRKDNSGRSARDYAKLEGGNAVMQVIERRGSDDQPATARPVYGPSF